MPPHSKHSSTNDSVLRQAQGERAEPQPTDARRQGVEHWLAEVFGDERFELTTASADASFRRYFRVVRERDSFIVMDAPPDKENVRPFIEIARLLADVGVNVPAVREHNLAAGYLLLTDLGTETYFAALTSRGFADSRFAHTLYDDALAALLRIQTGAASAVSGLPSYSDALLRREMTLFDDWFLRRHLNMALTDAESQAMQEVHGILVEAALAQPRVFVHRDYHSRNLMVSGGRYGPAPGILDFQDALVGPLTYDLVSLLRDCYVAWPASQVRDWVRAYWVAARDAGMDVGAGEDSFQRWFDLMGVQRHLKAIGIFARLWHRDGKAGYLDDIPRTMNYVAGVSSAYPELAPLQRLLETRVLPQWSAMRTVEPGGE